MARTSVNSPMVSTGKAVVRAGVEERNPWPERGQDGSGDGADGWANKADLADSIAERLGIPRKRAMRILDTVLNAVGDLLLTRNKVAVKGFGTFESKTRKGRAYKHPMTGESVAVPDKGTVVFKPSKNLLSHVHQVEEVNPELVLK